MLQVVKRLVGAERVDEHERAISNAQNRLDVARRDHAAELETAKLRDLALENAQAAFDSDPSGENADAVLAARRAQEKAGLFLRRTAKAEADAREALFTAERARDERELALVSAECDPEAVGRELRRLVDRHGEAIVSAAIELGNAANALGVRTRLARRRKLELLRKLGFDTSRTETEVLAEGYSATSFEALGRLLVERIGRRTEAEADATRFLRGL